MVVELKPLPRQVGISQLDIRRLDLEEYHRLIEIGFFAEDERVELIEGVLHSMSPRGPFHAEIVSRLVELYVVLLRGRAKVRSQDPITIPLTGSEPEPDLALVAPREGGYLDRHPLPEEVFLVGEVADSSLREDRGIKLRMYAAAGIEEYWIINLVDGQVEVYREPATRADETAIYRQHTVHNPGDMVSPLRFPDCAIDVALLLR